MAVLLGYGCVWTVCCFICCLEDSQAALTFLEFVPEIMCECCFCKMFPSFKNYIMYVLCMCERERVCVCRN